MTELALALNAGSSSIKFAAYDVNGLKLRLRGLIERIGDAAAWRLEDGAEVAGGEEPFPEAGDHKTYCDWLLRAVSSWAPDAAVAVVGHRVVHGGLDFYRPVVITPEILAQLAELTPLAPSHQPHNLAPIKGIAQSWPDVPQVACFDTSFHRTQPRLAQLFALPRALSEAGIVRYGFHGLSYDYIARQLPKLAGAAAAAGRVIVAHLGHGASMCAMVEGKSVATSMGFTALDGLVMGKRCGDLDPGVVLHLMEHEGMSVEDVKDTLYKKSGLLGVSGISSDVRSLLASQDPHAQEALDLFAYRAARQIGSLAAALQGLDALVFTAGVGEHSPVMRAKICAGCRWLGVEIDPDLNEAHGPRVSKPDAATSVWVIPTNEEWVIAEDAVGAIA